MTAEPARSEVTLAELLAGLSLVVDLGLGQPMEHVLRQTVISMRLGDLLGLPQREKAALYYVALLAWVGCGSDSHELATWFGDDLAWRAASYEIDPVGPDVVSYLTSRAAAANAPLATSGTGDLAKLRGSTLEHCVVTGTSPSGSGWAPKSPIHWSSFSRGGTAGAVRTGWPPMQSLFPLESFSSQTCWSRFTGPAGSRRRSRSPNIVKGPSSIRGSSTCSAAARTKF